MSVADKEKICGDTDASGKMQISLAEIECALGSRGKGGKGLSERRWKGKQVSDHLESCEPSQGTDILL